MAKYRIHIQNLEFSELCSACSSFNALVFWTKSLNTIRFIFFSTFSLHWESSGWTAVCFKIKGDEYDTCTMYCLNSFVYFCQWNMHSCSHEYTNYTFCCFSGLGFLCIVSFYFVLASSKNNFVVFRIKTQGRILVVWPWFLVPHIQRKSTPQLDRSSHTLYSFFSLSIFSHNNNNNKSRNLFTEFLAFHCMLHLKTNKHGLWSLCCVDMS